MTRREAFELRVSEAKKPVTPFEQVKTVVCPDPNLTLPPYTVRGIPETARNYRLRIRAQDIISIAIMLESGVAVEYFVLYNEHGEYFPDFDRVLSGNG